MNSHHPLLVVASLRTNLQLNAAPAFLVKARGSWIQRNSHRSREAQRRTFQYGQTVRAYNSG
jgi:hypothetical protein